MGIVMVDLNSRVNLSNFSLKFLLNSFKDSLQARLLVLVSFTGEDTWLAVLARFKVGENNLDFVDSFLSFFKDSLGESVSVLVESLAYPLSSLFKRVDVRTEVISDKEDVFFELQSSSVKLDKLPEDVDRLAGGSHSLSDFDEDLSVKRFLTPLNFPLDF